MLLRSAEPYMLKERQLNGKFLKEVSCTQIFRENQSGFHLSFAYLNLLGEHGDLQGTALTGNVPLLG